MHDGVLTDMELLTSAEYRSSHTRSTGYTFIYLLMYDLSHNAVSRRVHVMKAFRESSGNALHVLDLCKSSSHPCSRKNPGTHWRGSWMCPRASPSVPWRMVRDCSVGIAIRYRLNDPGIESRWGEIIRTRFDRTGGPPSHCTMCTGFLYRRKSNRGVALTTHPYLQPRVKKSVELYL